MRSDYNLYGIAVICFILAGAIAIANIPGYKLAETNGIALITIFTLIGIISAAVGYSARPKQMMPTTQRTPATSMPLRETVTQSRTPKEEEISPPPPTPPPVEEVKEELQPTSAIEPAQTVMAAATETEPTAPTIAVEEEKPKPVRRRRKKAAA